MIESTTETRTLYRIRCETCSAFAGPWRQSRTETILDSWRERWDAVGSPTDADYAAGMYGHKCPACQASELNAINSTRPGSLPA